jgi:hypothetical protein
MDKDLSEIWREFENELLAEQDSFWESLTKDQQLLVFCKVVRKLVNAELKEGRSYRGVLYDEFEFGMESYVIAQASGFMELHNAIKTL